MIDRRTKAEKEREERLDRKLREERMKRYDAHMNQYGHYSELKAKTVQQRSPILDEILRNGGTLVSDYVKRVGMPPQEPEAVPDALLQVPPQIEHREIAPKSDIETLAAELAEMHRSDPAYQKVYSALRRARIKAEKEK